jgi:hypothetical protein
LLKIDLGDFAIDGVNFATFTKQKERRLHQNKENEFGNWPQDVRHPRVVNTIRIIRAARATKLARGMLRTRRMISAAIVFQKRLASRLDKF